MHRKRRSYAAVSAIFISLFILSVALSNFAAHAYQSETLFDSPFSNGTVAVQMAVSPSVATAGDTVVLNITVTNNGTLGVAPDVFISIPDDLSFDALQLPTGATVSLADQSIDWQPLIPPGQQRNFTLPVRIDVADTNNPFHSLSSIVKVDDVERQLAADLWVGSLPQVDVLGPSQVSVGQAVQLFGDVVGAGPISQQWDLGDGRLFRAENPTTLYASTGQYEVTLFASNPLGTSSAKKTILVVAEPNAFFELSDDAPAIGEPIQFNNKSGGLEPLIYTWAFGDGSISTEANPIHTYAESGNYIVRLVAQNGYGSSETLIPVTVGSTPNADFIIDEKIEMGAIFRAIASGDDSVDSFEWRISNGDTQDGKYLEYTFYQEGPASVSLVASNNFGSTIVTQELVVLPGTIQIFLPIIFQPLEYEPPSQEGADAVLAEASLATNDSAARREAYLADLSPIDFDENGAPTDSAESQLIYYINQARQSVGLPELTRMDALNAAAKFHTEDMAFNRFRGHQGSDSSWPAERLAAAGYDANYAGEATAWGFDSADAAVNFWLTSPGHRPIILNDQANEIGVGFTVDWTAPSVYYWTAEFGSTLSGDPLPELPAPTATPEQQFVSPEPSQQPTPQPSQPTATRVPFVPTSTPVPQPTATPYPTNTPWTPWPTATAAPLVVATATPQPTAVPPTQAPQATAVPTNVPQQPTAVPPTNVPAPTATPTTAPTAIPTVALNKEDPTAIPPTATPLPTETPVATQTSEATAEAATSTPEATVAPTIVATAVVTATVEPTATAIPVVPTATVLPTNTPEPTAPSGAIILATATPQAPTATPDPNAAAPRPAPVETTDEGSTTAAVNDATATPAYAWNPGMVVTQFMEALWADASGAQAAELGTPSLKRDVAADGVLSALSLSELPSTYSIFNRQDETGISHVWVRLTLANGESHQRIFTVLNVGDVWLVDLIAPVE